MTRTTDVAANLRERLGMTRVAFALLLAGCVGEASVSYQGVVLEGPASAYEFATSRDPRGQAPIAGATISLLVNGSGKTAVTDATGNYPLLETVFGGFAGADTSIEVRVEAPDGRTVSYKAIYEDTDDPTFSERSCETPCPTIYLNFALAPR